MSETGDNRLRTSLFGYNKRLVEDVLMEQRLEIDRLRKEFESLQQIRQDLERQSGEARTKAEEQDNALSEQAETLSACEAENESLSEAITALREEHLALVSASDSMKADQAALQQALEEKEAAFESLSSELEALRQTKAGDAARFEGDLARSGDELKAARIERDVLTREKEALAGSLHQAKEELAKLQAAFEALTAEKEELAGALDRSRQELQVKAEENVRLSRELEGKKAALSAMQAEKEDLQYSLDNIHGELDHAEKRILHLNNLNDQQKRHMDEYETMLAADPVGEAQAKARRIINDAIAQSESMMQTAQETRDRVMTAARTTYYDALQFKMDLVEHFNTLERSIDASIGVIGKVEIPKLPETPIPHIDVDPKDD